MAVTPPSIRKSAPTTYAESADARYTASFAISNGSAIRLLGLLVPRTPLTASPCSSPGKRPNIAVSVGPGLRVFTRIPRSTSSALRIRARWRTAALQVETVEVVGHPLCAPTARLPARSVFLAACSDPSFKPQMATRAPSLSNSCAAASPIPLLPPVTRIFLSVSLPIVVTPLDYGHAPMRAKKKFRNFPAGDRELNSGFSASQPDQARCAQSRSRPSSLER